MHPGSTGCKEPQYLHRLVFKSLSSEVFFSLFQNIFLEWTTKVQVVLKAKFLPLESASRRRRECQIGVSREVCCQHCSIQDMLNSFWCLMVTTCKLLRQVRLTLLSWPTSSCSSCILLTQITYAVSFAHCAHCQNFYFQLQKRLHFRSWWNYEYLHICVWAYWKNLKDLSRKKQDFSKECTNDEYGSAWALGSTDFQRLLGWKTR